MSVRSLFRQKVFRNFFSGRFFLFLAVHTQMNVISLQVYYQFTRDELMLGIAGLCEAVPFIFSALWMGHLADLYNKKKLIFISLTGLMMLMSGFVLFSRYQWGKQYALLLIFSGIVVFGVLRALFATSLQSLLPQIIAPEWYEKASAMNSAAWHLSSIAGPLLGTFLFIGNQTYHPVRAYLCVGIFYFMAWLCFAGIPYKRIHHVRKNTSTWEEIKNGIHFVIRREKIIFSALLLDMLAVLFGGVTAILPAFVDKVLVLSPENVAWLRVSPAIGAITMGIFLARYSVLEKAGKYLFASVISFGVFTLCFAFSPSVYWAILFLFLCGAADNISIVIRHTLIQLRTPDEMRGKISAINSIFIGSSNEIGAFESGLTARYMGIRPSILFGSVMTILSTWIIFKSFPDLIKLNMKKWIPE